MDSSDDNGRWLTYDEIAEARGTEKIGAIRWVQRHKWRRQPGNDGLVRVLVPEEALVRTALRGQQQQSRTVTPPDGDIAAAFEAALTALQEAHAGEIGAIRKAHDSDLTALREQLRTTEARHSDELAGWQEQLRTAKAQHAAELAALQEQSHTVTARAEGLASDLTALQEQLHTASARAASLVTDHTALGEQLRTAENRAETAEQQAEALRQAEAARKARGRLRRAWDGWLGR
jgi:chromosome segregation ATPase